MVRNQKSKSTLATTSRFGFSYLAHTNSDDSSVALCQFKVWGDQADDLDDGCRDSHEHHGPFNASAVRTLQGHVELRRRDRVRDNLLVG